MTTKTREERAQKVFLRALTVLEKDQDPEMTKEAVDKLWNDDRYSKNELWNIAFALQKKLCED